MASDGTTFESLDLPRVLNTSTTDFVEEFYQPLLSRSVEYKRGVGFFTTNWIKSAARGIAELANNDGTAKWITSPKLTEEDWEAIKKGEEARSDEVLRDTLQQTITNLRFDLEYDTRNAVAWMIADGLLEIKLAVPTESLSGGDFHDKFGIFYDTDGNRVAFHGSQNDSQQALRNYEAYSVDCDWLGERDAEGVDTHELRFDDLWNGRDPNVNTYTIPEGVAEDIAELRDYDNRPYDTPFDNLDDPANGEKAGPEITLRDYQREAVDSWFENDCIGLFRMATGTGKTFTALAALNEYIDQHDGPVLCVIAVPVTHLATQWAEEMEIFGLKSPRFLFGTANSDWKSDLSRVVSNIKLGIRDHDIVITTHKTLSEEYFREKVSSIDGDVILLGDEVHGLGSEEQRKGLLENYTARIGLSATPERHYDEEGTEFLLDYFGGTVYEYTLSDAIPEYLTPYEYDPIIVEMTEDELEEYREESRKLATAAGSDDVEDEIVERLAMKRAAIVKGAENKYRHLRRLLQKMNNPDHLLVYTNPKQIDTVQQILNEEGIVHHKFTYEEDEETRKELLEGFDEGRWDALVAMKCLDEGVDVPATRQAILMSNSGNPMQFIQRRGRVLRQSEGKDKATIYDMVVVPWLHPPEEIGTSEQNLLKKELDRFSEFAENAKNRHTALNVIDSIRVKYRI
ncbi:Superfamily II DNA or RNA helicase [Halogranum rubrum]|uniref:Superfamily II DNA or RNA helicase n=1 Tax=Halogranum rubrum TaxID=553466 RepID=A0A1I4JKY6_9EURY|nr:DEAD/DEAH box helicase family protein [Halogranum rubrum]SFL67248.1 Superfamily II DNA or RNA helicase [Halogranum rubrum]